MVRNRVPAALAAAVIAACGVSAPALASSSKTWTKKQCESYVKTFDKKHKKPTKAQAKEANKTLKSWGCKEQVK